MQIHKLLCSLEGTRPTQTSPVLRESEASRRHNGWLIFTLGVESTESERCALVQNAGLTLLYHLGGGDFHNLNALVLKLSVLAVSYPLVSKRICGCASKLEMSRL